MKVKSLSNIGPQGLSIKFEYAIQAHPQGIETDEWWVSWDKLIELLNGEDDNWRFFAPHLLDATRNVANATPLEEQLKAKEKELYNVRDMLLLAAQRLREAGRGLDADGLEKFLNDNP